MTPVCVPASEFRPDASCSEGGGLSGAPLIATAGFLRFIPRGAPRVGPVAQWSEPAAHNGLVAGSSPARPTKVYLGIASFRGVLVKTFPTVSPTTTPFEPIASAAAS